MTKKKLIEFIPDAYVIRTTKKDGTAYKGFQWPTEVGNMVECPDWESTNVCGNGFHGLLDGEGDWSYLSDEHDALWYIIGVKRDECINIDNDKVKFPRGKVIYCGKQNHAMFLIMRELWGQKKSKNISSTAGEYAHSSTAGYRAHSSTAGYRAVSSGLGYANRARAGKDGAIVLTCLDNNYNILAIKAAKIGDCGLKANTWYSLDKDGNFIEEQD